MASLQHDIFDDPEPADASSVARLRFGIARGARALVAVDSTTAATVGAAQCVAPAGGATEVVGVAVAPSHRRRGLAAAMVSALVRESFDAGLITVFLEAAPGADGAYRNAGFVRTSTSLHISLEEERDA
jgi:predicted GNAT family acetyltransferase